jgi:6-phosphogluconolactonase (cycloisomerase 2 family)
LAASFQTGAVYFITNEPSGNNVISATIGGDGQLTMANTFAASGNGAHGVTESPEGPDAMFSQGSIVVNPTANLLATANAGSHTVSLFSIDPNTPSDLKSVGPPMSSGGEFPMSVAFTSDGTALCALNAGAMDGVQCFTVNATTGLTVMPNTRRFLGMNQTTPPSGPLGTASQVIFSQDDSTLYAAVKGNPKANVTGYIAAWNMTAEGLSEEFVRVELPQDAVAPFSLTPIPNTNAFFSADAGVGADVFDFSMGAEMAAASPMTRSLAIPNQGATCWSAYSPQTGSYYVSDLITSTITEIALNGTNMTPSILNSYPIQAGVATLDLEVASLGSQDYLYILMPNTSAVNVLRLDQAGNATQLQQMDIAGPARQLNLNVSPNYLAGMASYVKNSK